MKEETGTIYQHAIEHLKEAKHLAEDMKEETRLAITNAIDAVCKEETGTIYQHAIEYLKEAKHLAEDMKEETRLAITNAIDAVCKEEKEHSAKIEEGKIEERIVNALEKLGKIDDVEKISVMDFDNGETAVAFVYKTDGSTEIASISIYGNCFIYFGKDSVIAGTEK